jgi:hypothetical protein
MTSAAALPVQNGWTQLDKIYKTVRVVPAFLEMVTSRIAQAPR